MQIKSATQSPENQLKDRVYAAMETGNHNQARILLKEIKAAHPAVFDSIRMEVIAEYGISL